MPAMDITRPGFRVLAVVLLVTLVVGLATPGRAEALEPFTILAIAGVAVVVVVIVVYLIVANMHDSQQRAQAAQYMACVESDAEPRACWAVPSPSAIAPAAVARAAQAP
jgi:hypothetical protein